MDGIFLPPSAPYEKSKFLGSGGSMVARLKLKEIDGRAPPGVNLLHRFTLAVVNSAPAARKGPWLPSLNASPRSGAGETFKLRGPPKTPATKPSLERRWWPG